MNIDDFQQSVTFRPAHDRGRHGGKHGVEITFVLKGPDGAVEFTLYSNWHLPHVREDIDARLPHDPSLATLLRPLPAWIAYHSPEPLHGEALSGAAECLILDGPCYGDKSFQAADRYFDVLVAQGDEGLWRELRQFYEVTFTPTPPPPPAAPLET